MARKYTVLQYADRLEKLAKGLKKTVVPPFRRNLKIMQRALFAEYWESPFAARIWNWTEQKFSWTTSGRSGGSIFTGRKSGPSVKLGSPKRRSYIKWSHSEGAYVGRIYVLGLAAKLEHGGRLRRHVFWDSTRKRSRTPGLAVPRRPVFDRVVENKLWPRTVDDISKDFWKFVEREL